MPINPTQPTPNREVISGQLLNDFTPRWLQRRSLFPSWPRRLARSYLGFLLPLCLVATSLAIEEQSVPTPPPPTESNIYATKIKPFFRERCYGCHGALKQEGNLRLDTVEFMRTGGDSGEALLPGEEGRMSLLLERVSETDPSMRMPPEHEGEAFTPDQIEMIRNWIVEGAVGFEGEEPEKDPEEHWSFLPLVKPELPSDSPSDWVRNPIDAWIAKGHREKNLTPQPEASRALLLRRLYLDLIGVLPSQEEIDAFQRDTSDDWYEKVVERLLDDPRHGERWARHWMDNWRYSDWWGLNAQLRNSQRHMWHWRDWIIESLNEDLPYDEMVRLMLAGDELQPTDPQSLRATGYLARNFFIFNRSQWMDETVEHVGKAFLGITMNCAKCHDHKFDPISQLDYYRMRAFFEPYHVRVDMLPSELDTNKSGIPRAFDGELEAPTYLFVRGEEAQADTSKVIPPGVPDIFGSDSLQIEEIELPPEAHEPQRNPWVIAAYRELAENQLKKTQKAHQTALERVQRAEATLATLRDQPTEEPVENLPNFIDDFETLNPSHWKTIGGTWSPKAGSVEQTTDGATSSILRYLGKIPTDFEATLQFRILGGSKWRSIGIGFDVDETAGNASEQFIYVSGVEGGSKVQASFSRNRASQYPNDGVKRMAIALDRDYTLQIRVRDSLINVYLDGERVIAWHSLLERRSGELQLVTYDAIASIEKFQLSPLGSDVGLFDPKLKEMTYGDKIAEAERSIVRMQGEAEIASLNLDLQKAELESINQREAAFLAKWNGDEPTRVDELHGEAVRAERNVALKKAQLATLQASQRVEKATAETLEAEKKKLEEAREAERKALALLESKATVEDPITPFTAALWSATRFKNTAADDPQVTFPAKSTGRRTALARWITSPNNPLAARAAVNHLWARHLDQPLAPATFDLGRNSPEPVNPELLDWLAAEFIENGWSMKHIHRLIVNSATYRMSSSVVGAEKKLAKDPDNKYWWRRTPIRLESQAIRDTILALAGTLDPTIGGPEVPPAEQDTSKRRSLYFFHSNNERNLFLTTFDEALVSECYRREQSIVPQQALALTNSALAIDNSKEIADRIWKNAPDDRAFVLAAFRWILGIEASEEEIDASLQGMQEWSSLPGSTPEQTRANLVLALLNHNDFVTLR